MTAVVKGLVTLPATYPPKAPNRERDAQRTEIGKGTVSGLTLPGVQRYSRC